MVLNNKYSPSEFTRQSRRLDELSYWKSIEFRNFLLYFGPIALKNVLQQDMYEHFLHLSSAIRILSCDTLTKNVKMRTIANSLLMDYVEHYIDLYGVDSINSNVHNLVHMVSDVEKFGSLQKFSAYPFESTLYRIKRSLKCGAKPLRQAANRTIEMYGKCSSKSIDQTSYPILAEERKCDENEYYLKVKFKRFVLATNDKDKWFLNKKDEVIAMNFAVKLDEGVFIEGRKIKKLFDFFENPFSSHLLNIYEADLEFDEPKHYSITDIKCKMVGLQNHSSSFVFMPLLHTY